MCRGMEETLQNYAVVGRRGRGGRAFHTEINQILQNIFATLWFFFTFLTIYRKTASVTHNSANFTSGSVFRSLSTTEALGAPTGVTQRKKKRKPSAEAWGMILGSDGLMSVIHSLVLCTRCF